MYRRIRGAFPNVVLLVISDCLEQRVAEGRKDYHELQIKLDGLLEDLSQYLNGPVNPIMTTSMKNLCK